MGAKFFINSNLGTDPLDVLLIGLNQKTGLLIGTCSIIITILFLGLSFLLSRKLPHWTSFITAPICGYLLDIANHYFSNEGIISPLYLVVALILCSYGSALILESRLGIRIMDVFILTVNSIYGTSFSLLKILTEFIILVSGILLNGPFGIATIAFVFLVGPLIVLFDKFNHRVFNLPRIE